MKIFLSFIAVIAVCLGCESTARKADPSPYKDFESAIEAFATADDVWQASAAAKQIYSGGVPAIKALRGYLNDDRVISARICSRSINSGDVTLGEQALWTIQDMIEVSLPKVHDNSYYVLRNDNLEQWLDQRQGMSITELQIEAATAQLKQAKQQMEAGDLYANDAVGMIENRLAELKRTMQD